MSSSGKGLTRPFPAVPMTAGSWIREKGCIGVFLGKLIPMFRTLISIPAGVVKMPLDKYVLSSACGIFIWNFVFVGAGYVLGDEVFSILGKVGF